MTRYNLFSSLSRFESEWFKWEARSFEHDDALIWFSMGFNPAEAEQYKTANFNYLEAMEAKERGFDANDK